MNRSLFTRIVRDLSANCPYFQEGCDAVGKAGIFSLVKCTSAIRQLAYAAVPDSLDEYLQIGEKTSRDCLMHFCNGVIELYGEEYLRRPKQTNVEKLYAFHENKHGFPGMIGSIDCTKWSWAQCPQAYRAQFSRDILAIQISTVASEAAFSTGGRVLDPYRTRLSTTIVEALICTQDWVRKSRTQINWDDVEDLIKDDEIVKDMEEQLEKLTERDKAKQTGEI
ncbi:WAT1-related protein isoform X1 [Tanacetum coccineum]